MSAYFVIEDVSWLNGSLSSLSALLFYVIVLLIPPLFYHLLHLIYDFPVDNYSKNYILPYIVLGINSLSFIYLKFFNVSEGFVFDVIVTVMNYTNFIVTLFVFPIVTLFYWIKSLKLSFNKSLKNTIDRKLTINQFVAYSIFLISFVFHVNFKDLFGYGILYLGLFYFLVSIALIGFYLYKDSFAVLNLPIDENIPEDFSYFNSIEEQLIPSLEKNKLYLNSKFTLKECAKSIGTNEKYLSTYLNKVHEVNFNTFINNFRIQAAKDFLLSEDAEKYTIEAIAQMSGFNSKSSFNSVFKKYSGLTPSEFKNEYKV